jgi:putative MATE family efflux protein
MGRLDVSTDDVTDGPIASTLVVLALPLVVQNLVQVLNQLVDTFWLGRLGEAEVAAVGLNFPLIASLYGVVMTATVGTQIIVAQRVGDGADAGARRVIANGVALAGLLAIAVVGVVAVVGPSLVATLAADPAVAPLAVAYLTVWAAFFPFGAASNTLERGFIGWGDTTAALWINLAAIGTNVLLDPFLILGIGPAPRLGVEGAAFATGLGYAAGLLVAIALAAGVRDSVSMSLEDLSVSADDLRELVSVGAPISGKRLAGQSARVLIVGVVAIVGGPAGLAAYTVGARIATIAFVPATGFGSAAQSMVGQNLGAGRRDRAHRTIRSGVAIAGGVIGAVGVVQWLLPGLLTALFVPGFEGAGFELTIEYLRILAYSYWAMGVSAVLLAAFNGASRTRISFLVDLLKYWGMRIPLAVAAMPAAAAVIVGVRIGGLDLGMAAIFWAVTGSNVVTALGVGVYYLSCHERMFSTAAEEASGSTAD